MKIQFLKFVGIALASMSLANGQLPNKAPSQSGNDPHAFRGQAPCVQYVGIPSSRLNFISASQRNSQWCWAACIEMVLRYEGVVISQEEIVASTYGVGPGGNLPDWAGSFQAITANLNNSNVDQRGRRYRVQAAMSQGAPHSTVLLQELSAGRPVIVGYASGPNSGHAVVVTAASYIASPSGPIVQSIIVRDPYPTRKNVANQGRVEYPAAQFARMMQAAWFVRVR